MCEEKTEKTAKMPGKGASGRFEAMFDFENFSNESKMPDGRSGNFFDKMNRSALDFSAFGCIL